MTTILIIAVAVNVVLFLLTIYTEIKRAKAHRDKILGMKDERDAQIEELTQWERKYNDLHLDFLNLREEYESYKTKVETNELMSVPNTQDFRDLQASYNKLAEEHEKLEKWYSRPSKRYLLRKVFKVFDVKSKEQLAEVLNIKEIKL